MKATAELKMLSVSVLKPAAYNPRKKLKPGDKEYEKIKNSITEFGFADPLVVNADMTIIGGHQRLTVAMELGYTEVPCAVVDIDKTREKALNIALNKITGAWDDSLLADLLKDIEDSNFDLGKTGFEPPEIETLFNKVHSKEVKEDDFDVESELKQPCFSKEGDLWHLGKHIVLCGDSTKAECYDTLMDGTKANLVLSDPPYNVDVEETAGKIMNDNMGDSEFYQFLLAAFQQMHGHLADDGSIYIFHADTEGLNFRKAFKDAGFYLSGCCIWKKNALVLGRSPYQWQHEPCLYPNPEIKEAMALGMEYAKKCNADLLLATDPDCDRVGIAVKNKAGEYELLTGNQTGMLLLDYICSQRVKHGKMPADPVMVKTIVTMDMGEQIATHYGLRTINVLTGFKFIGEQIGKLEKQGKTDSYVFGFEESYGYLTGSYVRDKDGVDGAYMICEMFSYYATQGISLLDKLDELYKTYGYCLNTLHSYEFDGSAGFAKMQSIMQAFRGGIKEFGGKKVVKLLDYAPGLDGLPKSDVLKFLLEDNCSIVVRPSGTEPKLKTYISVSAENKEAAEKVEAEIRKSAEEYLK